jgi:glycogen debranching enzyme
VLDTDTKEPESTTDAWSSGAAPPVSSGAGGNTTLVEGSTFCLSSMGGDVLPGWAHGLFVSDTRILSGWRLELDGRSVEPLSTQEDAPYAATFVGRTPPRPGLADSTLLVTRRRYVADGMREEIVLENLSSESAGVQVTLSVEVDFADLFEVKEGRVPPNKGMTVDVGEDALTYQVPAGKDTRTVRISATSDPMLSPGQATFRALVPSRGRWSTTLSVQAGLRADETPGPGRDVGVGRADPAHRLRAWRMATPQIATADPVLAHTLRTSAADLGALQIQDPDHPDRPVVAAGAPWFMALFGRDSLLTSWMALPVDQQLALGTVQTLAEHQGTKIDPLTEEQPGRILHEVRLGRGAALALGGGNAYYGTADATPLFVALLGEMHRWGVPEEAIRPLIPNADRAVNWIHNFGDRDGDGFVEYKRETDRGLVNQGWKDSFDGINDAQGRIAEAPIALCEVQGYCYAAYQARARLAADTGDDATAALYRERAEELKAKFNATFWLDEVGYYATALDGNKRPMDSLTSNMGHCLWSGIVDDDKADSVARHLMSPPMFSGFGVRTLGTNMGAYNPMSYHNGSIWPHDSAIVAAGLMRYGYVEEAQRIANGLLAAAQHFGGRLPELFCGFDREDFPKPVPYPTSCSPQAWAAASPILLTRTLLRFEPDVPAHEVQLNPALPENLVPLHIRNLPLAGARLTLEVRPERWDLDGLPDSLALVDQVRTPTRT